MCGPDSGWTKNTNRVPSNRAFSLKITRVPETYARLLVEYLSMECEDTCMTWPDIGTLSPDGDLPGHSLL
ncbi:MAG: hypothetical protein APR55_10895 [Methanolinea sp. SDB]|nr:MAG: hypothetical protein APR55_10895 [Methanolinea sp. SDB]